MAVFALWCWLNAVAAIVSTRYTIVLLGLVLLGLALAASVPSLQGFAPCLCHVSRPRGARLERTKATSLLKPCIALTFDDGPDPATTLGVMATLARFDARATFFLVGEKASCHPELVRTLAQNGHSLGVHGYRHNWRSLLSPSCVAASIGRTCEIVSGATGRAPVFFRPPYGVVTPAVALAVRRANMRLVGWSVRSLDTVSWLAPQTVLSRVVARLRPGKIVLLHDAPEHSGGRSPAGPAILASLLEAIHAKGFVAVGLDELARVDLL